MRSLSRLGILVSAVLVFGCGAPPDQVQGSVPETPAASTNSPAAQISPSGSEPQISAAKEPQSGADAGRDAAIGTITGTWTGDLDGMIERRYIRVATAYNKTHYFIDQGVQRGTVYESMKLFEDELNDSLKNKHIRIHVVFVPMSRDQLLSSVVEGRADVAAAALTITPDRQKLVDFSRPTRTGVDEIVVTGPGAPPIARVEDLAGREVFVRPSSSYHANLKRLSDRFVAEGRQPIVLKPAPETLEDDDLLEMVNAGLVKTAVVDNYLAEFWTQLLPDLVLHPEVAVTSGEALGVAMRKGSPKLMAAVNGWIAKHGPKTMFGNLMTQRYLKSTKFAKSATSPAEFKRFQEMVAFFRKYGDQYDLDYILMAAQGFQESGLDQGVKSPVGAIGVMQVMPATAKDLKVGDITKTEANIHAGVKYIRFMIDQYFAGEPMDRLNRGLFAFAAYNAGPGRVRQLRQEAAQRGLDPNLWFNNVERIASERIGRETVTYVSNIYKYYVAYRLAMEQMDERRAARNPS